jgi:hypothetical protein
VHQKRGKKRSITDVNDKAGHGHRHVEQSKPMMKTMPSASPVPIGRNEQDSTQPTENKVLLPPSSQRAQKNKSGALQQSWCKRGAGNVHGERKNTEPLKRIFSDIFCFFLL